MAGEHNSRGEYTHTRPRFTIRHGLTSRGNVARKASEIGAEFSFRSNQLAKRTIERKFRPGGKLPVGTISVSLEEKQRFERSRLEARTRSTRNEDREYRGDGSTRSGGPKLDFIGRIVRSARGCVCFRRSETRDAYRGPN